MSMATGGLVATIPSIPQASLPPSLLWTTRCGVPFHFCLTGRLIQTSILSSQIVLVFSIQLKSSHAERLLSSVMLHLAPYLHMHVKRAFTTNNV